MWPEERGLKSLVAFLPADKGASQTGHRTACGRSFGKFLTAFRFRWAHPSGATTDLLPKDRITYAPRLSFRLAKRVGKKAWKGRFALAGSWPFVIPTGASPVEIHDNEIVFRSSLSPGVTICQIPVIGDNTH